MIFISYSHNDSDWKVRIEKQLSALKNHSPHKDFYWSDAEITFGENFNKKIDEAKEKAIVVIFLVSVDFMNSTFIKEKELSYFIDKNVKVVWFYLKPCSWQQMKSLSELEAVKFKNKQLKPLSALKPNDVDQLISETCKQLYEYVTKSTEPRVPYSDEIVYCCNRNEEIQFFNDSSAVLINVSKGQNLLFYSIEGLTQDDLESFSKSIQYKVLKERYQDIYSRWDIRLPVFDLGPLINTGKLNPDFLLIRFKDHLQKKLRLDVTNVAEITVNDIFSNIPPGVERMIYFITVNIPSTSFSNVFYKPFFDWIKNEFSKRNKLYPNVIVIMLFAFEKAGDMKDLQLENFVKKLTNKSNLRNLFSRRVIKWPADITEILHLGEHGEVSKKAVEEWNQEYRNGENLPSNVKLSDKMRMSEVIDLLKKILSLKI